MNEPPACNDGTDGASPDAGAARTDHPALAAGIRRLFLKERDLSEPGDEAPKLGRQQAAVEGFQAAFLRVVLAIGILIGGVVFAVTSRRVRELLPKWEFIPDNSLPDFIRWAFCPIVWVAAAGVTVMVTVSDDERKWRNLNWSVFVLLTSGTLIPDVPWPGPVSVAAGLFGLHYSIHLWLRSRDAERQWENEMERQEREQAKEQELPALRPKLLERYGGVAGFEEEDSRPEGDGITRKGP
jgi:hypothetical protein